MFWRLTIIRKLKQHDELLDEITRLVKSRDLDWADMRARCKRLLDRTEKAAQRTEESTVQEPEVVGGNDQSTIGLSPHQTQIQRMILAKRRANGVLPSSG